MKLKSNGIPVFTGKSIKFQGGQQHNENWQTLESRRDWEQTFRHQYLRPIFQDVDGWIAKSKQAMAEDEEAGAAALTEYALLNHNRQAWRI